MKPVEITDENFENEVLNSDKPVLIDFGLYGADPVK
jgi:thioredoxin-like negative regulator of GroEL